jgi:hypothetical protein
MTLLMGAFYPLRSSAQILFEEDFSGIPGPTAGGPGTYRFPAGWTLVNRDGRTPAASVSYVNDAWERREDFSVNVQDSVAFSTSWYSPAGPADDWMITPLIGTLPTNTRLTWNALAYDPGYPDGYEVRLSTTVATAAGCGAGPQLFAVAAENSGWTARNVSLASQAGQSVYVCFHNDSVDKFLLVIDDIVVERVLDADPELVSTALPSAYTQIPVSQSRPLTLTGTVRNSGAATLTNVGVTATITRDGTQVYQQGSLPIASLAPGASSPFTVPGYAPDSVGVYEIAYEVTSTQGDQGPSNSTATRSQVISEEVFARDDGTIVGSLGIGAGTGGVLGQTFGLVGPDVLTSVTFTLTDVTPFIGQELRVDIYDVATPAVRAPTPSDATRPDSGSPVRSPDEIEPLALALYTPSSPVVREPSAGRADAAHRFAPNDPPTTLLGTTVAHVVTAGDSPTFTLQIAGGPLALDAGDFFLGVREPNSTLTLGLTNNIFTEGTTWVNWPASPFGTWANNEDFGASFSKTYALRANVGAPEVPQQLVGVEGWRMLASPGPTTVGAFLDSLWTQGFPGADDSNGDCTVFAFDESLGLFDGGWTCAASGSAPLGPGDGLLAYVFEDDDPRATAPGIQGGFPKTLPTPASGGTVPFSAFSLTYTNNPTTPAHTEGWNLVGNPLASAFDWDAAVLSAGLSEAIYVYDPNYLGGDYRTWSRGVGGDLDDGLVPQNQGFFVHALAGSPALTIPQAAVVGSAPAIYGRTVAPDPLRLELAVLDADGTATPVSVAFVAATGGASTGDDASDAVRFAPMAWPRAVLATASADGTPLAVNVLPTTASSPVELPLTVSAAGWPTGPLALDLTWTGALPTGWTASLLDRVTGTETALEEGGHYRFVLDVAAARGTQTNTTGGAPAIPAGFRDAGTAGTATGERFALTIVPSGVVTGTEGSAPVRFTLDSPTPNPARGTVTLSYTIPAAEEVSLVVYDALGRKVAVLVEGTAEAGRHTVALAGASLPSGVYLVRLTAGREAQTRRLTLLH